MKIKNILISLLFYLFIAFGISLTIKADIGVSSFNSFNVALSNAVFMKVGTITTIINLIFLLFCILLNSENKIKEYLLMFIALIFFGIIINIFLYTLLSNINCSNNSNKVVPFGIFKSTTSTKSLCINILSDKSKQTSTIITPLK